jgi:hypothetical protein
MNEKWTKSSFCGESGSCIEVMYVPESDRVCVKIGQSMRFATAQEWDVFVAGATAGDFDLSVLKQKASS